MHPPSATVENPNKMAAAVPASPISSIIGPDGGMITPQSGTMKKVGFRPKMKRNYSSNYDENQFSGSKNLHNQQLTFSSSMKQNMRLASTKQQSGLKLKKAVSHKD